VVVGRDSFVAGFERVEELPLNIIAVKSGPSQLCSRRVMFGTATVSP
jgi:hypothetical protein